MRTYTNGVWFDWTTHEELGERMVLAHLSGERDGFTVRGELRIRTVKLAGQPERNKLTTQVRIDGMAVSTVPWTAEHTTVGFPYEQFVRNVAEWAARIVQEVLQHHIDETVEAVVGDIRQAGNVDAIMHAVRGVLAGHANPLVMNPTDKAI